MKTPLLSQAQEFADDSSFAPKPGWFGFWACVPRSGLRAHPSENGYFDLADGKPVREEKTLKNKIALARDEILKAIPSKGRSVSTLLQRIQICS